MIAIERKKSIPALSLGSAHLKKPLVECLLEFGAVHGPITDLVLPILDQDAAAKGLDLVQLNEWATPNQILASLQLRHQLTLLSDLRLLAIANVLDPTLARTNPNCAFWWTAAGFQALYWYVYEGKPTVTFSLEAREIARHQWVAVCSL